MSEQPIFVAVPEKVAIWANPYLTPNRRYPVIKEVVKRGAPFIHIELDNGQEAEVNARRSSMGGHWKRIRVA